MIMNEEKRNKKLLQKKRVEAHKEMVFAAYQSRKAIKVAPKDICISLQHINKIYPNHVQAVYDFNLDIKEHEFIVFVGPSGCGKSTTLRMIAGLEDITFGDLYINGKYANETLPKNRDIAMVFQNYALYPNMNVYNNIAFSLKLKHLPKEEIKKRVLETAKLLDISEYLDRKPSALSGGQRQRVALGRAIVRDVKIFLMDEPLSNLDAKLRVQMRSEIVALHNKIGSTTIYVTHDQTEAMTMATRIVVMKDGVIQQIGTPREVYENPENLFVATFIGSAMMNVLEAEYKKGSLTLPNGFTFKLSKEQDNKVIAFNKDMLEAKKQALEVIKENIKKKLFEIAHPKYEKDMELYRREVVKRENKVALLKQDLDDAKEAKKEESIIEEITKMLEEKEKELEEYREKRLEEIKNGQYKELTVDKVEAKKEKDPSFMFLVNEKNEVESAIEYYQEIIDKKECKFHFGLRPEHFIDEKMVPICSNPSKTMDIHIDLAELLGDQYFLYTQIGGKQIIAKTTTDKDIHVGDTVKLSFDLTKFHLFDMKSEKRVI